MGTLLEAAVRKNGCVSGGKVVRGDVGRSEGSCCNQIGLVGGQGKTMLYKIEFMSDTGRRCTLAEVEAKREVGANCEEVKRREDKRLDKVETTY